jgi:hypothetical protein
MRHHRSPRSEHPLELEGSQSTTLHHDRWPRHFFYPAELPDSIEYHKSASMNGKLTNINDIAPIVRFLVTEGWWINGQTIFADGGYTTR